MAPLAPLSTALLVLAPPGTPATTTQDRSAPEEDPRATWFRPSPDAFAGAPKRPRLGDPFDIVAADMDRDGDPDLLANWHHGGFLELLENVGGRFEGVPLGRSGLIENRGFATIFATSAEMKPAREPSAPAGLRVWHEPNRTKSWHFLWRPAEDDEVLEVDLTTSVSVEGMEGLAPEEVERPDERRLRIRLPAEPTAREWSVATERIATQLLVRAHTAAGPVDLFVGPGQTRVAGGELELWKPDPHGMAWVDVESGARPELFVARGGIGGLVTPPHDPKTDHLYRTDEGGGALYRLAEAGVLPREYGRGRRVEWVDLEGDGRLELSLGNRETPNALLVRDPTGGALRDRAPALGLDFVGGDIGAWGDLDGDGLDDYYFVEDKAIHVARNRGTGASPDAPRSFERIDGTSLGLELQTPAASGERFVPASLRLADFDADGHLDLWLLGHTGRPSCSLFLRDGDGFRDATEAARVPQTLGEACYALLDVDDDGFEDVVGFGLRRVELWHNVRGEHVDAVPLDLGRALNRTIAVTGLAAATSCDVDADGRTDLVALGQERHVLTNRCPAAGRALEVVLAGPPGTGAPVGTLVRALYADGKTPVQRLGSARATAYSQTAEPLRFGLPPGRPIESVRIRWPGTTDEATYPIEPDQLRLTATR